MGIGPTQEVAPPVGPEARRYSILDAAVGPLDLPGGRATDIAYTQSACGPVNVINYNCEPLPVPEAEFPGIVTGSVFDVEISLECSLPGFNEASMRTAIARAFASREHMGVEKAVTAMIAANAEELEAADDVISAIGALEQYIYGTASYGLGGYIFAPFDMSAHFAFASAYGGQTSANPSWRTPLGTTVVFASGLTDTLLVSGQVILWRDAEIWIPDIAGLTDRTNNTWQGTGRRSYVAAIECASASIQIGADNG